MNEKPVAWNPFADAWAAVKANPLIKMDMPEEADYLSKEDLTKDKPDTFLP